MGGGAGGERAMHGMWVYSGVMSMVMKTKDGREVRESERNLGSLGEYSEKRASKSK